MTKPLDKKALRREMRVLRRRLLDETPDAANRAARKLPVSRFARFSIVGAYCAQGTELDPGPILQAILDLDPARMQAALPVAADKTSALHFRLWRPEDPLKPDVYGIPSPMASAWMSTTMASATAPSGQASSSLSTAAKGSSSESM